MSATFEPMTPTARDSQFASEGSRTLARLIHSNQEIRLYASGEGTEEITLPANLARLFQEVLEQVGQGQSVVVLPVETELTTSEAAEMIGVSRPFLVQLLEQGEMPFHLVGTHRRVHLKDILRYKQEKERRVKVMQ